MTAQLIILPVVRGLSHTLDALEQRDREMRALFVARCHEPKRTRPLLVVSNDQPAASILSFKSTAPVEMAGGKGRAPNAAGRSPSRKGRK